MLDLARGQRSRACGKCNGSTSSGYARTAPITSNAGPAWP